MSRPEKEVICMVPTPKQFAQSIPYGVVVFSFCNYVGKVVFYIVALQIIIPITLFIVFGIRKNCLASGRSLLLHQFARTAIGLPVSDYSALSLLSPTQKLYATYFSPC
jgi:hypothetical protein